MKCYFVHAVTNLGPIHFPIAVVPDDSMPSHLCPKQVEVDLELARRGLTFDDDPVYEDITLAEYTDLMN